MKRALTCVTLAVTVLMFSLIWQHSRTNSTKVAARASAAPATGPSDIPNYGRVHYRNVFPGIDLAYYGQRMEALIMQGNMSNTPSIQFVPMIAFVGP